jgi:hypothetical protein
MRPLINEKDWPFQYYQDLAVKTVEIRGLDRSRISGGWFAGFIGGGLCRKKGADTHEVINA